MQMTQMQCADFFALVSRQCDRVVDRAVSRSPANDERVAFDRPKTSGTGISSASLRNLLRRFAVIAMCNFGLPVG